MKAAENVTIAARTANNSENFIILSVGLGLQLERSLRWMKELSFEAVRGREIEHSIKRACARRLASYALTGECRQPRHLHCNCGSPCEWVLSLTQP